MLGAVSALPQRNVKRLLAFSSINHTGFILLGVEAATLAGVGASLYYLFAYSIMTVGTFGVITMMGGAGDAQHDLSRYRGIARRQPLLGVPFVILLLAQAGAPFTTGFLAKFGHGSDRRVLLPAPCRDRRDPSVERALGRRHADHVW